MTDTSWTLDDDAAEALLSGASVGAVADALAELRATGDRPAPMPSPALAALLADGLPVDELARRRRRRWAAGVAAGAVAVFAVSGVAAAHDALPQPAQHVITDIVNTVTPFDITSGGHHHGAPGADDPNRRSGRGGPGGADRSGSGSSGSDDRSGGSRSSGGSGESGTNGSGGSGSDHRSGSGSGTSGSGSSGSGDSGSGSGSGSSGSGSSGSGSGSGDSGSGGSGSGSGSGSSGSGSSSSGSFDSGGAGSAGS